MTSSIHGPVALISVFGIDLDDLVGDANRLNAGLFVDAASQGLRISRDAARQIEVIGPAVVIAKDGAELIFAEVGE